MTPLFPPPGNRAQKVTRHGGPQIGVFLILSEFQPNSRISCFFRVGVVPARQRFGRGRFRNLVELGDGPVCVKCYGFSFPFLPLSSRVSAISQIIDDRHGASFELFEVILASRVFAMQRLSTSSLPTRSGSESCLHIFY